MYFSGDEMKRNKQSGYSLIEVGLAVLVVGVVGAGFYRLALHSKQVEKLTDSSLELATFHEDVISGAAGVLMNVKDSSGRHKSGVCALVSTPNINPGVGEVLINVSPDNFSNKIPASNWSSAFQSTVLKPLVSSKAECKVSGPFSKCLEIKETVTSFKGYDETALKAFDLVAQVTIEPVAMDPIDSQKQMFAKLAAPEATDVKKVGFLVKSDIFYSVSGGQQNMRRNSTKTTFVWPGEVSYCDWDFQVGNVNRTMRLSLTGVTPGDPSGNTLYNRFNFSDKNNLPPISGFFRRRQITSGSQGAGFLKTDTNANVEVSCNERKFRCKSKKVADREFESLNASMILNYDSLSSHAEGRPFVTFAPNLRILNASNSDAISDKENLTYRLTAAVRAPANQNPTNQEIHQYYLDSNPAYAASPTTEYLDAVKRTGLLRQRDHFYRLKETANPSGTVSTSFYPNDRSVGVEMQASGTHEMNISVKDSYSDKQCKQICENPSESYFPVLEYTMWDTPQKTGASYRGRIGGGGGNTRKVACITCFTKNCTRLGLKTFGLLDQMPDEPIDSGLPECAAENDSDLKMLSPYKGKSVVGSDLGKRCLAVDSSGDLVRVGCAEKKEALCFNFGRFMRPRNPEASPGVYPNYSFWQAGNACYWMAKEEIDGAKFNALLDQEEINPSSMPYKELHRVKGKVKLLNASKQGAFVAPQTSAQWSNLKPQMEAVQNVPSGSQFFTALYMDTVEANGGAPSRQEPVAFPPFLLPQPVAGNAAPENDGGEIADSGSTRHKAKRFGFYFSQKGEFKAAYQEGLLHNVLGAQLGTGANNGAILVHNMFHKGVYAIAKSQSGAFGAKFLCFNPGTGKFYRSSLSSGNQSDGSNYCKMSGGGVFVPPVTPLQWVQAMDAVAPLHSNFPYPNPEMDWKDGMAWVALQVKGTNPLAPSDANDPMSTWDIFEREDFNGNLNAFGTGGGGATHIVCEANDPERGSKFVIQAYDENNLSCEDGATRISAKHLKNTGLKNAVLWKILKSSVGSSVQFYLAD